MKNKITKKQTAIPQLLYKFRFSTINQLQRYLNHKDPHRIKEWLKILESQKIIYRIKSNDPTAPHIFCLDTQARYILDSKDEFDIIFMKRLYKEKSLTKIFIDHCLFIFDIYLFFLSKKEKDTTLHFFTQHELVGYDYLPKDLPDAYIAVETKKETSRYFLDLYDEYRDKAFLPRRRIKQYISYCEEGNWQTNTNNSPFPKVLFVLPNERKRKHIYHYGKAILEKSFEDISLFLTTQDNIKANKEQVNIWQPVQ